MNTTQMRLFFGLGKASHKSNTYPFIPVAHVVQLIRAFETIKLLLNTLQFSKYFWKICGDLKVISLIFWIADGLYKIHKKP